ncbi:MAG: haloalkane dehalogenase [Myxococcota bacterium]
MTNNAYRDKRFVEVDGKRMAYVEVGEGRPIVFQHGNPTSSYLWRNIMPHVADLGRCIAVDLIGMGDSDKLTDPDPNRYAFRHQRRYLAGAYEALGLDEAKVTLVLHDWGSALGFDWANNHRSSVRAIAYMEAMVRPFPDIDRWGEGKAAFEALRSDAGDKMVLEDNFFIEQLLPAAIIRTLSDDEMNEYRRPFAEPGESRRPTLTFPRELAIGGEPADVHEAVASYSRWMASNDLPKLFINAEPGAIVGDDERAFCRTWNNQTEVTVPGIHYIQEDSPDAIGKALRSWLMALFSGT